MRLNAKEENLDPERRTGGSLRQGNYTIRQQLHKNKPEVRKRVETRERSPNVKNQALVSVNNDRVTDRRSDYIRITPITQITNFITMMRHKTVND